MRVSSVYHTNADVHISFSVAETHKRICDKMCAQKDALKRRILRAFKLSDGKIYMRIHAPDGCVQEKRDADAWTGTKKHSGILIKRRISLQANENIHVRMYGYQHKHTATHTYKYSNKETKNHTSM